MNTQTLPNGTAPAPARGNKGNKGGRVALAWQDAWNELGEWQNGRELAEKIAARHDLKIDSLLAHFYRMAAEGHLENESREVPRLQVRGGVQFSARRPVTFYRIKR